MYHKSTLSLVIAFFGLFGLVVLDCGPLVSKTYGQRSNDNDDEGGDRPRGRGRGFGGREGGGGGPEGGGGRWGGRGRGGRGFGGDGEGGGERQRRRDNDGDDEQSNRDSNGDSGPSTTEFAQQLVKQRDKNGNMILEGEELEGLRGREARADANGDKAITVEEIVAALSNRNGSANNQGGGGRSGRGSDASSKSSDKTAAASGDGSKVYLGLAALIGSVSDKEKNEANQRKTYRFTPAEERQPKGLPSWFASRDRNKDGQVAMSEYSRSWSARSVGEFRRYDLNNDGVVTAKEAAED